MHEAKNEAEARYYEAEAEAEAENFGPEARLALRPYHPCYMVYQ